jgi:modulator of FtsH protease HflK
VSWNNGNNPWGGSGGGSGGNQPNKPDRGPERGPWGNGPRSQPGGLPDLDDLISRMQDKARRFVPGGGGAGRSGRGQGRLAAVVALVAVVVWLASGFYRVQPDQQGVVLRFGAFNRTTLPGLNYHIPWPVEQALTPAVTRINRVDVGFRGNPGVDRSGMFRGRDPQGGTDREVPEEALMLTGDENIIDINFSVFWRIRNAEEFLFATRNPEEIVKWVAESMMRQTIGRTPIQPALTEARARIEQDVASGTQATLDQYKVGVEITQVQLQRVDPPAAVIESFRDVQRANTDAERVRNEAESYRNDIIPRARGDAARLTAEAEGARQAMVAEASGQAQRFLSVYQAYEASKDVTLKRLYIETMQEILQRTPSIVVDDKLQGIVPYLPLDVQRQATAPRPAVPGPAPQGAPR